MSPKKDDVEFRIGTGFDIHRLGSGRPFVLGGVTLPFEKGPVGHSDGDPLLHALCDALLGAAGLDDLGSHFPDTDPKHKNASSAELLGEVVKKIKAAGFEIVNVDAVVIAEAPKLGPHRGRIREGIAKLLGVDLNCVNFKGKTAEKLGSIGAGEAIACNAVALLRKI